MTRANILIKTRFKDGWIRLEVMSDAFPKNIEAILRSLLLLDNEHFEVNQLAECCEKGSCGTISFGQVGNFSYTYEVDLEKKTYVGYASRLRWINAPKNWKERGWNCYRGNNGRFGYNTWVKGMKVMWGYVEGDGVRCFRREKMRG